MLANDLYNHLKEAAKKFENEIIKSESSEIEKFCEITGIRNFKKNIIPQAYFMSFTNKIIKEIFLKIGPLFISQIKGLIHVSSEVEFFKDIFLNSNYKVSVDFSEPILKKGKKGDYYSIIFNINLLDEQGNEKIAIDHHEFFFKL
ncbi:MAG: hypothetical protein ACTSQP_01955 [Promethearchaeota archaeon]